MKDSHRTALAVNFNLRNPVHFFALGFGSGLLKPAPGTWGTLAGVTDIFMVKHVPLNYIICW